MTPDPRVPLPNRRRELTRWLTHIEPGVREYHFLLSIGYYDAEGPSANRAGEIFIADGGREGSVMQLLMNDVCVVVSLLLQHGARPEAIAKSLGQVPKGEDETVLASFLGTVLACLIEDQDYDVAAAKSGRAA